jgi:hypothetical protein
MPFPTFCRNHHRKTTTTHPDVDNEEGDGKKPAEVSSRRCSQAIFSVCSHDPVAAQSSDQIAVELAEGFGPNSKQRLEFCNFFPVRIASRIGEIDDAREMVSLPTFVKLPIDATACRRSGLLDCLLTGEPVKTNTTKTGE